jgi:hypothetical protein
MGGHHFGCKQKFLRKTLVGRFIDCAPTSSFGFVKSFGTNKTFGLLFAFERFQTTGGLGERKNQQGTYNWLGLVL